MDKVDNSFSGAPVSVIKDFDDPTVSLAVEEAAGFAFNLTLASADSLSGPSGVYDVEYRVENPERSTEGMGRMALGSCGRTISPKPGCSSRRSRDTACTSACVENPERIYEGLPKVPSAFSRDCRKSRAHFRGTAEGPKRIFEGLPKVPSAVPRDSKDRVDNEGQSAVMGPYEAELETIKYYYFGGQRVAMRGCDVGGACDDPLYLHGDHLGSVSLTTDSNGEVVAQARYMPYRNSVFCVIIL